MKQTKMKFITRNILGFSAVLVVMLGMIGFSLYNMNQITAKIGEIIHTNTYRMQLAHRIKESFLAISEDTKAIALVKDSPRKKSAIENVRSELQGKYFTELRKEKLTPAEQTLVAKMETAMGVVKPLILQVIELELANKNSDAVDVTINKTDMVINALFADTDRFIKLEEDTNGNSEAHAEKTYGDSFNLFIILSIFAVAWGIFFGYFTTRGITGPMNRIVGALTEGATQVAAASNQLSASAQQLSSGTAEQASAIEETSATLQESSSALQQNNANTAQAAQLSEQAKDFANRGNLEMQQMMLSMEEIRKSSNQIAKIVKVIDDIAFQTNILALNAAIEAARAGEAGMGFGVVAEEVRNLAQRSARAAKETTDIIEANINLSGEGMKVAERVRNTLHEITNQSKKVSELMGEISAASREQFLGIEQVNSVMNQLESITEQNAANAEEGAASAGELSAQAESLNRIVGELSQLFNRRAQQFQPANPAGPDSATQLAPDNEVSLNKADHKIKVVTPEDIIPLEKDSHQF